MKKFIVLLLFFTTLFVGESRVLNAAVVDASTLASNPLANAIGTPCAENITNAWLDIALLVDVSNSMLKSDLQHLTMQIATIFEELTFGQGPEHSSRFMLIGYGATKATVLLTLEEVVNFHTVFEALLKLPNLYAPDDNGGDIKIAFETAYDNFPFDDLRRQVIILVTSSFDSDTFDDPIQTARQLKNDGITIITLAYDSSFDFPANLKSLASPGYNFISSDTSLITKIHKSLTEINCFCPPGTLQFTTIDKTGKEIKFSDCFEHFSAKIDPSLANNFCQKKNGISTYTTTPEKLNFIVDKIVPKSFQNVTEFLIGIYKKNDQWFWHNYNGNDFKIGLWPDVSKNVQGDYGYFGLSTDNSWKFSTIPAGKKYAKFILCQVQSCDTDHVCNMDLYTT